MSLFQRWRICQRQIWKRGDLKEKKFWSIFSYKILRLPVRPQLCSVCFTVRRHHGVFLSAQMLKWMKYVKPGDKSTKENWNKPDHRCFHRVCWFSAAVCGLLIVMASSFRIGPAWTLHEAFSLTLALPLPLEAWPAFLASLVFLSSPSLQADGGKEERKEELITSLMEKGELCQNVAEEGGREIIFNICNGSHIVRGTEMGEEGGENWWRREG